MTTPPASTPGSEPIHAIFPALRAALSSHPVVLLEAPPGSGKTTHIPQALLEEEWLAGRKITMLAPRRLAARAAAQRIATLLGEEPGQTVGYRVRQETCTSPATRIEIVTGGILIRRLQNDPELQDTGLVIFDEFHERSLDGDLALALCRDLAGVLNPTLRLLIMSATMDGQTLGDQLDAPLIRCDGRQFPVETTYIGTDSPRFDVNQICRIIVDRTRNTTGSILVFLPGAGEIRKVHRTLADQLDERTFCLAPLYGNLTREEQLLAIAPPKENIRKIVLATNIAETSLTIEGISTVIDSGLERRLLFDPQRGISRLVTRPVSRASANQRRGRAGRLGPGHCLRLWSRHAHQGLSPENRPEISAADLAPFVLELALWGVTESNQLCWLDPPPHPHLLAARRLLLRLGALDKSGAVTSVGSQMAGLPLHPRLARMVLGSRTRAQARMACDLAAIISERDPLQFPDGDYQSNLQLRLTAISQFHNRKTPKLWKAQVDHRQLRHLCRMSDDIFRRLPTLSNTEGVSADPGRLLAFGFPDRIAALRTNDQRRYLLANGKGGRLPDHDELANTQYLVVAELTGNRKDSWIRLALAYSAAELHRQFTDLVEEQETVDWDDEQQMVRAVHQTRYLELVLATRPVPLTGGEPVEACLLAAIRRKGIGCLQLGVEQHQLQHRVSLLARLFPEDPWPDFSDATLMTTLEEWLAPFLDKAKSLKEIQALDLTVPLQSRLPYALRLQLERLAPRHLQLPTRRIPIDYCQDPPVIAPKLQEMFGCTITPTIAGGRQPLLLHLLSPAGRPLQITQDLHHFWQHSYKEIQKEMKGRYPKHPWPDDPLNASPTNRAKPRKK